MVRFKLKELMLQHEKKDANITIDKVEKICPFFECRIEEVVAFYKP
jgi:DNA-binding Xre family transcriptional regulator